MVKFVGGTTESENVSYELSCTESDINFMLQNAIRSAERQGGITSMVSSYTHGIVHLPVINDDKEKDDVFVNLNQLLWWKIKKS